MEPQFSWEAPEYEHIERSNDWYYWAGTIAAIIIGLAVWQKNYIFGVLVLMATVLLMLFSRRKPESHTISVSDDGIVIDEKQYLYRELRAFTIIPASELRTFNQLVLVKPFTPMVTTTFIIDPSINIESLREFLLTKLSENEFVESKTLATIEKFF